MLAELIGYGVFASYYITIAGSFYVVFRSILDGVEAKRLFHGRPFFFLRTALGAFLVTGYFLFKFIQESPSPSFSIDSYFRYMSSHHNATVGQWLAHTGLFEEAWQTVCGSTSGWWWSSFICTWTVIFTAILWTESNRRGIKFPWAYMLLGQLIAISVSTSLFITAIYLHPPIYRKVEPSPPLIMCLALALISILLTPNATGTKLFLPNLLGLHGILMVPLFIPASKEQTEPEAPLVAEARRFRVIPSRYSNVFMALSSVIMAVHWSAHKALTASLSPGTSVSSHLYRHIFHHPAQSSISFDVIWSAAIVSIWFLVSGSTFSITLKVIPATALVIWGLMKYTGLSWSLVLSVSPIVGLLAIGLGMLGFDRLRSRNLEKRRVVLAGLGMEENVMVPGTDKSPPYMTGKRIVVGFWHPYCNAGGGGERVLWSALAHIQRTQPEVIILVYSGDYPTASKEDILNKVKNNFAIPLDPSTIIFIPLASRHLISDDYWSRFTLLGQSLGSMWLAYEGLCGKDGLWGDIFLDTMGYAFTYPLVRLLAGSDIAIGAYTHYPTVSNDMVKRVREGSFGVENAGASKSWLRTQIKLLYYRIFTSLYATSLLYAELIMTNSSWTQTHMQSLLGSARSSLLASMLLKDTTSLEKRGEEKAKCEVVYPPCDTKVLVGLGKLEGRKREIVSLAQFRPEKEHYKQIEALSELFKLHSEYRDGSQRVHLTLMGGSRNEGDETRVESLRALAAELGVQDNVEFLVNAPYPEIVRRLGEASIGLNTMQDEHFGINVVEFMAAGLIPIVHASAGPFLDILVPHNGQRTGFHAKTPEEFAEAIHQAFSMSSAQQLRMRKAARAAAVDKFSEEGFAKGFERNWEILCGLVMKRRLKGVYKQ